MSFVMDNRSVGTCNSFDRCVLSTERNDNLVTNLLFSYFQKLI